MLTRTAFIGGGNMASAIVGGLLETGYRGDAILIVEPDPAQRERLRKRFGIAAMPSADASLTAAEVVVWAVKPQAFRGAATVCRPHIQAALQLSVMAGIRSSAIVAATGSERVVRAMPNMPALIGQGIAGLFAGPGLGAADRAQVEALLAPTGECVWVGVEADLDAVTALSGSGPAYVFYVLEAMLAAGAAMGLDQTQVRRLALRTLAGATALAAQSVETPERLRRNVSSPGGTTEAATSVLEAHGVKEALVAAIVAARDRACSLADEFDVAG
ncbi:MAG: pyrroline-5-carboxylate reductase [Pseudomonadota bacterium]|nr:pyrroline-5-carboxylate reductase [Pseudomonadota bacterium]